MPRPIPKHRRLAATMLDGGTPLFLLAGERDDEIRYHAFVALVARGQAVTAELTIPMTRAELRDAGLLPAR